MEIFIAFIHMGFYGLTDSLYELVEFPRFVETQADVESDRVGGDRHVASTDAHLGVLLGAFFC
jgi:hypothetical protein